MADARTQLSALVERAHRGETIIIARAGVPRARLVPLADDRRALRVPGKDIGRFRILDGFDDPLPPDLQAAFDGES